jgi:hypothetical protein
VGASGCDLAKDSGPCSSAQGETLKAEAELEPFIRLIEALEPWPEELVLIGGWAHGLLSRCSPDAGTGVSAFSRNPKKLLDI